MQNTRKRVIRFWFIEWLFTCQSGVSPLLSPFKIIGSFRLLVLLWFFSLLFLILLETLHRSVPLFLFDLIHFLSICDYVSYWASVCPTLYHGVSRPPVWYSYSDLDQLHPVCLESWSFQFCQIIQLSVSSSSIHLFVRFFIFPLDLTSVPEIFVSLSCWWLYNTISLLFCQLFLDKLFIFFKLSDF